VEPSLVCYRNQLVVLYHFCAWSGLHHLDFALCFYRHPGVLFRGLNWGTVCALKLCSFRQLLINQPLRQLHRVRGVDTEEDVQYLRLLLSGLDPSQGVMLLLQFLDLQASGQFRSNVIQQFVVRQRMRRINQDVTEQLVVDVPVQLLHQLRETHLRLHLQEHQRHFPFRGEVGLPSTLGHHALAHQPRLSAISCRGRNFFILPSSLFSKVSL